MPLSVLRLLVLPALVSLLAPSSAANGQTQSASPQDATAVFRVNTELVQTDVMVFDKSGRFVDGLRPEDFELRIDGKVKPVSFFERIAAGTANETAQLTAARSAVSPGRGSPAAPAPLDRGRTIFFYVDDLRLDLAGLKATQKVIGDFIDNEMGQDDEVAIASSSGQIGFLQQLTNIRTVLRRASQRITLRSSGVRDNDRPLMTEYHATLIDRYDRDILAFFIEETRKLNPFLTEEAAEAQVRMRSRFILQQGAETTTHTLSGLEGLIRSSSTLPGRKLVFFISGGFLLDYRNSDPGGKLQRITSAAARSGTVIYSIDARGLVASLTGASCDVPFDASNRLLRASLDELNATQDGLNALARDTGGKPILNTNALGAGLSRALQETSVYYLLAWEPDRVTQGVGQFRSIEVILRGKPDFSVRVRRGFFDIEPTLAVVQQEKEVESKPEDQLRQAMSSPYPERAMPISLSTNYLLTTDQRMMIITSLQIPREFLSFSSEVGKQQATIRITGLIMNDRGQVGANFTEGIAVGKDSTDPSKPGQTLSYTHQIFLSPGLYQVRVAARDEQSGRTGSAHSWIEIPDPASGHLTLSSLLIGTRRPPDVTDTSGSSGSVTADLEIQHRFRRGSVLRFFLFTYNAALAGPNSKSDLATRVLILRDNQPVITTEFKKMATENGVAGLGLPYAADLSLAALPPGRYILHMDVIDRVSKRRASQQTRFEIE
jgi:VWFA-related protein